MPTIIVQSNPSTEQDSTATTTLFEDVQPEHLASDHHAAQLIERLGWAVTDAKNAEDIDPEGSSPPSGTRGPAKFARTLPAE
jgi:hypothetical protein